MDTLTDTWTKVSSYIKAPTGAYAGKLWFSIVGNNEANIQYMSLLIDDVYIADVTEGRQGILDAVANSTAINTTNTKVTELDGKLSTQATSISELRSSIDSVNALTGDALRNAATAQDTANTAVTNDAATAAKVSALESSIEFPSGSNLIANPNFDKGMNGWKETLGNGHNSTITDGAYVLTGSGTSVVQTILIANGGRAITVVPGLSLIHI